MPILLIFLSLLFVSCQKNQNDLSKPGTGDGIAFSNATAEPSFMVINYKEEQSTLRRKLLNTIVNELTGTQPSKPEEVVAPGDELLLADENFLVSERDLKTMKEKEAQFTKLIVSYEKYQEIYFLKEQLIVKLLAQDMKLQAGPERAFRLVGSYGEKTVKGMTIYLVSYNTKDLLENDKYFNQTQVIDKLDNSSTDREFTLHPSQVLEIEARFDILVQSYAVGNYTGAARCTPSMREMGCEPCTFSRHTPGGYVSEGQISIKNLNLSVLLNANELDKNNLPFVKNEVNYFKAIFIPKDLSDLDATKIRVVTGDLGATVATNHPMNVQGNCSSQPPAVTNQYHRKMAMEIIMTVKGRGHALEALIR